MKLESKGVVYGVELRREAGYSYRKVAVRWMVFKGTVSKSEELEDH